MLTTGSEDYDAIAAMLRRNGLELRGGFSCRGEPELAAPVTSRMPDAVVVLLAGNVGGSMWTHFDAWRQRRAQTPELSGNQHEAYGLAPGPLDQWSAEIIRDVAQTAGGKAFFPWETPYLPFQRWGAFCENLQSSPIGILMHPEHGLWHAYRGVIVLPFAVELPERREPMHLCDGCVGRPCIAACPVAAFDKGVDVAACAGHLDLLKDEFAEPDCLSDGCASRNACPYSLDSQYCHEQRAFHMSAYYKSVGRKVT